MVTSSAGVRLLFNEVVAKMSDHGSSHGHAQPDNMGTERPTVVLSSLWMETLRGSGHEECAGNMVSRRQRLQDTLVKGF